MEFNTEEEKKLAHVLFKILNELQTPNFVCDKQGIILFANKKYKEIVLKLPENQVFWKICPLTNRIPSYFEQAVEQGIETCAEITFKKVSFIIHVTPVNTVLANDLIYIVYLEDITLQHQLNEQLESDQKRLQKSCLDTILALSTLVASQDPHNSSHQKRVALLSMNIASKAKITDTNLLNTIYYGALIHDIGKIAIPMEYLVTPRRLTTHEYEIMKTHVDIGYKIIEHVDFPWDIKSVVYQHHERMDGSGYPNGIKGEHITIPARIVALADVYEAMSTNKPYRKSLPQKTVFQYLKEDKGTLFDAYFVESLFECLSELKGIYEINPYFKPLDFFNA